MEITYNRPVVTSHDHPFTIYRALHSSFRFWRQNMPSEVAFQWEHKARNAYETVADEFCISGDNVYRPEGKIGSAVLWDLNPDQLELALVAYGCNLLEENGGELSPEIMAVDEVLSAIDTARANSGQAA